MQMGMPVAELKKRLTLREFHDWIAFNRYEATLREQQKRKSENQSAVRRPRRGR